VVCGARSNRHRAEYSASHAQISPPASEIDAGRGSEGSRRETAAAFVAVRYRRTALTGSTVRRLSFTLLAVSFAIVAFVSLLGVFVNKVAPLD
jgi:hypothetical protein